MWIQPIQLFLKPNVLKTDTEIEKAIYYISRGFVILAIFQFIAFFRAYSRVFIMQASLLNYFEENFSDFPIEQPLFYSVLLMPARLAQ